MPVLCFKDSETPPQGLCTGMALYDLVALIFRTEEDGQIRAMEDPEKPVMRDTAGLRGVNHKECCGRSDLLKRGKWTRKGPGMPGLDLDVSKGESTSYFRFPSPWIFGTIIINGWWCAVLFTSGMWRWLTNWYLC
jgi:hypothetical protein